MATISRSPRVSFKLFRRITSRSEWRIFLAGRDCRRSILLARISVGALVALFVLSPPFRPSPAVADPGVDCFSAHNDSQRRSLGCQKLVDENDCLEKEPGNRKYRDAYPYDPWMVEIRCGALLEAMDAGNIVDKRLRSRIRVVRGRAIEEQGLDAAGRLQHDRVLSNYDRAVNLDPANAEAFYARGRFHLILDHFAQGMEDFEKSLFLNPSDQRLKRFIAGQRTGRRLKLE